MPFGTSSITSQRGDRQMRAAGKNSAHRGEVKGSQDLSVMSGRILRFGDKISREGQSQKRTAAAKPEEFA